MPIKGMNLQTKTDWSKFEISMHLVVIKPKFWSSKFNLQWNFAWDETNIVERKKMFSKFPTVLNLAPGLDNLMDWQPFLHCFFSSIWMVCANLFIMNGWLHPFILFNPKLTGNQPVYKTYATKCHMILEFQDTYSSN